MLTVDFDRLGLRPGDRLWAHWPDDAACVLPAAPLPAINDPDAPVN